MEIQFKRKPWDHQLTGMNRAFAAGDFAFFFEPGTGKSATLIGTLRMFFKKYDKVMRTIIFCPPVVVLNWPDEWKLNSDIPSRKIVPLIGTGKKRLQTFLANAYDAAGNPQDVIFVTNYESLLMEALFTEFSKWRPQAIGFDESHYLKSATSKRGQLAEELANPYDRKTKKYLPKPHTLLLSGTPILNNYMDLFQQFKIMDGGKTFGHNFFVFRNRYFVDRNSHMPKDKHFPDWQLRTLDRDGFDAEAAFNLAIKAHSMSVEKSECLDLPPELFVKVKVGMSAEQTRLYKELKKDLITFFNSQACTAPLAIVKALRLLQITAGFISVEGEPLNYNPALALEDVPVNESVAHSLESTPKDEALEELLESLTSNPSHKILVWAVWKENYPKIAAICAKLKLDYVEVHGGISAKQKQANVERFNTDPSCRIFIGNPASGGIGINLVVSKFSIFYSRRFSLGEYLQALARNYRGGSEIHDKITHYDIYCEGTIDEVALEALEAKEKMSNNLLFNKIQKVQSQT